MTGQVICSPRSDGKRKVEKPLDDKILSTKKCFLYCVNDCKIFLQHCGSYKIRLYERPGMACQMQEVSNDYPNVQERLHISDINVQFG